jgi:hypothetical protein
MFSFVQPKWSSCLIVLVLLSQVALGQTGGPLPSVEGRYFDVVGTDQRSVSYVNELGTHVVELCSRYLPAGVNDFPQRIFIALRPEDRVDFEGDYQVRQSGRGGVRLDIRWEAGLTQETLCAALVEAYVTRYVIFNYGPRAVTNIRFWAVSALAAESYLSLRPAQQISYIQEFRQSGVPALKPLVRRGLGDAARASSRRVGYWVVACLDQAGFDRYAIGTFLEKAVAGHDISAELENFILRASAESDAPSLEDWWQSRIMELLQVDYAACETMDVSLEWLTQMADLEVYVAEGGELTNLRALWNQRESAALRSILRARSELIRLRLARVNPAYYNAAQSLGALYETVLVGQRKDAFLHAFVTYLSDWEDTKRLHRQVIQALDSAAAP